MYERELGFKRGDISGNTNRLKEFAADANSAFDDFLAIAIRSNGTWQYDDSNHTDYPIITTDLVSGQRDYPFTTDETNNLILDIFRVFVKNTNGVYCEVYPVDAQSTQYVPTLTNGLDTEGTPCRYDKTANGFFLDPVPSYDSTDGLKVYINREPSYFTYEDTMKMPGAPGILHKYFFLKPALEYARRNNFTSYPRIQEEVLKMEGVGTEPGQIAEYFADRTRDEPLRLATRKFPYKFR